jgi:hypothetical protein
MIRPSLHELVPCGDPLLLSPIQKDGADQKLPRIFGQGSAAKPNRLLDASVTAQPSNWLGVMSLHEL